MEQSNSDRNSGGSSHKMIAFLLSFNGKIVYRSSANSGLLHFCLYHPRCETRIQHHSFELNRKKCGFNIEALRALFRSRASDKPNIWWISSWSKGKYGIRICAHLKYLDLDYLSLPQAIATIPMLQILKLKAHSPMMLR